MKKTALLFLLTLLTVARSFAVTDPKVSDFIARLSKYYYSLEREGLRSFQSDATGTISGSDPSEAPIAIQFNFSYLGKGLDPVLTLKKGQDTTPGEIERIKKIAVMLNALIKMWGLICTKPLFNPEIPAETDTVVQNPAGGFTVRAQSSSSSSLAVDFDSQASGKRMVATLGAKSVEMDLAFNPSAKGLLLSRLQMGIGETADAFQLDMNVEYQQIQGFELPVSFTFVVDKGNKPMTIKVVLLNYRVFGTSGVGTIPPINDTQIIPSRSESPGTKHFFWRVRSSTATVYLLGSVHTRPETPLLLPEIVEQCYQTSNYVGFESDFSDEEKHEREFAAYLKSHYLYPPDDNLKNHATPAEWGVIERMAEQFGLDPKAALRMKPVMLTFVLANLVYQKKGMNPNMGIDEIFMRKAKADRRPVFGMEFWYEPLQALETLEDRMQIQSLVSDVREVDQQVSHMDQMNDFWERGDDQGMDAFYRANSKPEEKAFEEILLKDRNTRWMKQFDRMLASKATYFVVVGSLHLVGQYGVPNWLKFKGYAVDHL